jgi:hypothetical protein
VTAAGIEEGDRNDAIFNYCLQNALARWDTLPLWLADTGIEQADERA